MDKLDGVESCDQPSHADLHFQCLSKQDESHTRLDHIRGWAKVRPTHLHACCCARPSYDQLASPRTSMCYMTRYCSLRGFNCVSTYVASGWIPVVWSLVSLPPPSYCFMFTFRRIGVMTSYCWWKPTFPDLDSETKEMFINCLQTVLWPLVQPAAFKREQTKTSAPSVKDNLKRVNMLSWKYKSLPFWAQVPSQTSQVQPTCVWKGLRD